MSSNINALTYDMNNLFNNNTLTFVCYVFTVRQIFRNEQRYYELLVEKGITSLSLFPYHLADIITKGLRVTPFNYYIDVLSYLLKNDRSYDTLPNFTAADCKLNYRIPLNILF